jgi:hypothetical protein
MAPEYHLTVSHIISIGAHVGARRWLWNATNRHELACEHRTGSGKLTSGMSITVWRVISCGLLAVLPLMSRSWRLATLHCNSLSTAHLSHPPAVPFCRKICCGQQAKLAFAMLIRPLISLAFWERPTSSSWPQSASPVQRTLSSTHDEDLSVEKEVEQVSPHACYPIPNTTG